MPELDLINLKQLSHLGHFMQNALSAVSLYAGGSQPVCHRLGPQLALMGPDRVEEVGREEAETLIISASLLPPLPACRDGGGGRSAKASPRRRGAHKRLRSINLCLYQNHTETSGGHSPLWQPSTTKSASDKLLFSTPPRCFMSDTANNARERWNGE